MAEEQSDNAPIDARISARDARIKELESLLEERNKKVSSLQEDILDLAAQVDDLTREVRNWKLQAEHDMLTDLLRRGVFARKVSKILRGRRDNDAPGSSLALLDVDLFKDINDVYGHPIGDTVLRAIARVIQHEIRGDDLSCRMGDEFLIFYNGASKEVAERITRRISDKVKELRFEKEGVRGDVRTSVSFGVAYRNGRVSSYEELYQEADRLMYQMKGKRSKAPS